MSHRQSEDSNAEINQHFDIRTIFEEGRKPVHTGASVNALDLPMPDQRLNEIPMYCSFHDIQYRTVLMTVQRRTGRWSDCVDLRGNSRQHGERVTTAF